MVGLRSVATAARIGVGVALLAGLLFTARPEGATHPPGAAAAGAQTAAVGLVGALPLVFVENAGQADPWARYDAWQ